MKRMKRMKRIRRMKRLKCEAGAVAFWRAARIIERLIHRRR